MNYDAVVLVSFGGPEKKDDVIPFLEKVLAGKNVPRGRMLEVAGHYDRFGGRSPINDQNRALLSALRRELSECGMDLPVYWGNRNWHPLLADTLGAMKADRVKSALAFVTSAYSSYSGCRQYLEDIVRARAEAGEGAPRVEKLRAFYNHPRFIEAIADRIREARAKIPERRRSSARLVYTAHSIPCAMARVCNYQAQLEETCRVVSAALARAGDPLVFQSRSGSPAQPWLEPDILEYLREIAAAEPGVDLIVAPVGFVSDHMEVVYDLDLEAQSLARKLGIHMIRAGTVGTHPAFVSMIRELILERLDSNAERSALGSLGPRPDACAPECCPPE
ncbi:MAG: ferrochelatase [Terriglobia bacterium]